MRIRFQILLLFKVMGICDRQSLLDSILSLQASIVSVH
jgi:hypothetical protein